MTAVAKAIAANQVCAACVAKPRDTDFTTALLAAACRLQARKHLIPRDRLSDAGRLS